MSAVWFDSNTVEMTTVEHCMYLRKFCELACQCYCTVLEIEIYVWNLYVCLFNYFDCNVSNLQDLEPALVKIKKDWRSHKLNLKHSHFQKAQVGLQQHLVFFSENYHVLKTITNVTQLRFVLPNCSCVSKQPPLVTGTPWL